MARRSNKLEKIDLDELFNSPANRGMLSFLERPPQEALDRLREKQKVDAADASRLEDKSCPEGHLIVHPGGSSQIEQFPAEISGRIPPITKEEEPVGYLPRGDSPLPKTSSKFSSLTAPNIGMLPEMTALGDLPIGSLAMGNPPSGSSILLNGPEDDIESYPKGDSPLGQLTSDKVYPNPSSAVTRPQGESLSFGQDLFQGLNSRSEDPGVVEGNVIGRRQKIRRIYDVQGGHSSGEQLLYQALWNAAQAESPESKIIEIGYGGMNALCHLDRKNCKKNIAGLIEKLSVEVVSAYEATRSEGYTYRIWSYREIKRRREAVGMIWVIRTSGVRFVNPDAMGSSPLGKSPIGGLRPGPTKTELKKPPIGPLGKSPMGTQGKPPRPPMGDSPTYIGKKQTEQKMSTPPANFAERIEQLIPGIDQGAIDRIWREGRDVVPDATVEEILFFLEERARILFRNRRLQNPTGLLLSSIRDWLTERRVFARRKQQQEDAEELERITAEIERNLRGGGE